MSDSLGPILDDYPPDIPESKANGKDVETGKPLDPAAPRGGRRARFLRPFYMLEDPVDVVR